MKKHIIAIILTLFAIYNSPQINILASNKFARIETTTPIFKSTTGSNSLDNIYCLAEQSYFVEIIGDYEDYYRVNYNGINGYLKKNDAKEVTNSPSTPYPYNIKIVINTNCNLRSSPTTNSPTNNVVSTLYSGEDQITFIGRAIGEESIDFGGSTWYYVYYKGNYGYIYNKYIKSISPIYANNEEYSYASNISHTIENPITHTPSLIIIAILTLPLIGVIIILYLPKKKNKSPQRKIQKNIERY